jgi:xanthine/uracil/vitamin C permease (AzgA family)
LACAQQWEKIYYEWNIPACGLCLLFGNVYYAWLATRLATKENRTDVTAQPYGMNTTVIYIMLYAITLPALERGHDKFAPCIDFASRCSATDAEIQSAARKAAEYGWEVSVTANFIVGLFEVSRLLLRRLGQVVVSNRRRLHPVIWRWFHVVGLRVRRRYL